MGGSGGTSSIGSGGLIKGEDCPRKFEATLVDVIQAGNADYAFNLNPGDKLDLSVIANDNGIILSHKDTKIGYLPPQRLNIIGCIKPGWIYSASIIEITGKKENPQIKVLVVGVPGS